MITQLEADNFEGKDLMNRRFKMLVYTSPWSGFHWTFYKSVEILKYTRTEISEVSSVEWKTHIFLFHGSEKLT